MYVFKFIHLPALILSFLIGLFAVFFSMSGDVRKVYIYPTPENIRLLQFKDNTDTCFEYTSSEVTCPTDKTKITNYTPQ